MYRHVRCWRKLSCVCRAVCERDRERVTCVLILHTHRSSRWPPSGRQIFENFCALRAQANFQSNFRKHGPAPKHDHRSLSPLSRTRTHQPHIKRIGASSSQSRHRPDTYAEPTVPTTRRPCGLLPLLLSLSLSLARTRLLVVLLVTAEMRAPLWTHSLTFTWEPARGRPVR